MPRHDKQQSTGTVNSDNTDNILGKVLSGSRPNYSREITILTAHHDGVVWKFPILVMTGNFRFSSKIPNFGRLELGATEKIDPTSTRPRPNLDPTSTLWPRRPPSTSSTLPASDPINLKPLPRVPTSRAAPPLSCLRAGLTGGAPAGVLCSALEITRASAAFAWSVEAGAGVLCSALEITVSCGH